MHTAVVVNPSAAYGRTGKRWPSIMRALDRVKMDYSATLTTGPGHATEIAQKACEDGAQSVIVVGGDGTINEVVNGLFDGRNPRRKDIRLGVLRAGTGCDLGRSIGTPKDIESAIRVIMKGVTVRADVGIVEHVDFDGKVRHRHFLNVADVGLGGDTTMTVRRTGKALGGFLSFLYAALATILRYSSKRLVLRVDDRIVAVDHMAMVAIANAQYFGGGMWIAPGAKIDDGYLDIIAVGDLGRFELLRQIPLIYSGRHLNHPKVRCYKGSKIEVSGEDEALIELDGELPGRAPMLVEVIPAAVNLIVGADGRAISTKGAGVPLGHIVE